jgi:hypothetical protein
MTPPGFHPETNLVSPVLGTPAPPFAARGAEFFGGVALALLIVALLFAATVLLAGQLYG